MQAIKMGVSIQSHPTPRHTGFSLLTVLIIILMQPFLGASCELSIDEGMTRVMNFNIPTELEY